MYTVLDSNIILLDANNLLTAVKDGVAVIPETVLAELDGKKNGFEEINYQARGFARLLSNGEIQAVDKQETMVVTRLIVEGKSVDIVSLNEYKADPLAYGGNDARIIEVAKAYTELYGKTTLMTNDMLMKFQAGAAGLEVTSLKIVDDTENEFVKELLIEDSEVFRTLHNANILEVDPEYKVGNYSYKFTCNNTNQLKLATISNGFITVLGKETETQLRKQRCAPINAEQLLVSKAIQDPVVNLVLMEGLAGSGKNIVAVSNAIRLMDQNRDKYSSIVYMRSPQNDESPGEEMGFLSGNDEKVALYLGPMEDTIDFIVRSEVNPKGKKKDEIDTIVSEKKDKLVKDYGIESMVTTGLRGRTFHDTIVIVDEAQNGSAATTQKVLTRIGKNCKVLVIGSLAQIDSKYVNKYSNGFSVLLNEAEQRNIDEDINMFAITLTKVVRSDMAMFAESLFTK